MPVLLRCVCDSVADKDGVGFVESLADVRLTGCHAERLCARHGCATMLCDMRATSPRV